MGVVYNKANFKDRRRQLRKTQTDCERILWSILSAYKITEFRFWNNDLLENREGVYEVLINTCRKFKH
ncbi:MAG: hypothetical protein A3H72_03665 [Candidatus Doudnabacteria bacterium RIFCSPLOWO2_02_FULL_48_8]|uniref:DUF559 domain-containing protein n=1 Tax=Candidatus Doudnabacteria bacterium RIFCSPHIGHO2_01_FULL_46_24 TaxID=1817825 RepID=A0A1F5NTA6_9BACT|nr:MAG: hypothetical protein A2720_04625 [Candidatus Doudnabacteria bacterium RIFCSPHIGHO2_01_FULL_46_24]OGE95398.1 MAG: hypothetical protein A3H72_03665 [Candidatus Doudnabacteria bacterium RIFCSPLOWO2_02_FULL_48_8]OGE95835.1 MAG: hypothetical protein A3E98_01575 [Candidatus Doudnabacteria bacterium RIFCSPHIGHO2_12_FULL_48_11]